ncbi:hypothetical protein GCM10027292_29150 [Hydrogenophaga aquatica]
MTNSTQSDVTFYPRWDGPFLNCTMEYECSADWNELTATTDDKIRHCTTCDKDVHFCTDQNQLDGHAKQGHCVAFYEAEPNPCKDSPKSMRLGLPSFFVQDGIAVPYPGRGRSFLDML